MHGATSSSLMSRKGTVQWFGLATFNFYLVQGATLETLWVIP